MCISQRIKQIRNAKKLSQSVFSADLGVTQASISMYESGNRHPDAAFLKTVCESYNVDLNWLITGEGEMFINEHAREGSWRFIRLPVVASIAAGSPLIVPEGEEPSEYLELPMNLLSLPPPYYAFRVEGESMHPFIQNGDYVVLSRDWRGMELNGQICGFRTPDGITLKLIKLQPKRKSFWLMPINHNYEPVEYTRDTDDLALIGVLVLSIRKYVK